MSRQRADIQAIAQHISHDLAVVRAYLVSTPATEEAWIGIEAFCELALRALSEISPGRLRAEAAAVVIAEYLHLESARSDRDISGL